VAPAPGAEPVRGVFVTGTDTGAGKSVLAAAICAALADLGERVAAFKPAVTGLDEAPGDWGHDHDLLASVATAGQSPDDVAPHRFGPPLSPHLATELGDERIEPARLVARARSAAATADALVVEGIGGLMVPLTTGYLVRDFALELGLPVVIAARTGLGTINHTLLTVEAARGAGLQVAGVVMTPWPEDPMAIERSNRETVQRLTGIAVDGLAPIAPCELSANAPRLPIGSWIDTRQARDYRLPLADFAHHHPGRNFVRGTRVN
jgi:dethiobiotin synthetase